MTPGSNPGAPTIILDIPVHTNFIKKQEDFTCENCATHIQGDGYTNHCYECFYSKHVDDIPGDRANTCNSLMKPVAVSGTTSAMDITHTCIRCGHTKNNKVQSLDNKSNLIELIKTLNSEKGYL